MLSLILRDRGSEYHPKIQDEDFNEAQQLLKEAEADGAADEYLEDVKEFVFRYASDLEWFDANALKNAKDINLKRFCWLLINSYQNRLFKDHSGQHGFDSELAATDKEWKKFNSFFKRREILGTHFYYSWGGDWTMVFSSGLQMFRLILGPVGAIAGRIPFVALVYFIFWIFLAIADWIIIGIPLLIIRLINGLPKDYFDSELLLSSYVCGDSKLLKEELRTLIRNDSNNSNAYDVALWGIYMREKLGEIIRKTRK